METQTAEHPYLTTAEVAKRFRIHPQTVLKWIGRRNPRYPQPVKVGGVPGKIGGKWLFSIEEILRYEKQQTLKPLQLDKEVRTR